MPRGERAARRQFLMDVDETWMPGDPLQRDAVVAACTLVAQADGWVTPAERARIITHMRGAAAVGVLGEVETIAAFDRLNLRFERDVDDGEATAKIAVLRLRGYPVLSRLLVETACEVAAADGGLCQGERTVLLALCDWLRLDPKVFDLVPEGPWARP